MARTLSSAALRDAEGATSTEGKEAGLPLASSPSATQPPNNPAAIEAANAVRNLVAIRLPSSHRQKRNVAETPAKSIGSSDPESVSAAKRPCPSGPACT